MSENIITVSQLTKYIKNKLETDSNLMSFTVSGEISNLTVHKSGHLYFAIKDETAVIRAVMFRGSASALNFKPENGQKIIARGKISVFEPSGNYQIIVTSAQLDGIGALYVAYEQLKKKLEQEGLFSQQFKRPIPKIPKTVGVITSPTGAAVRDIINVLSRRFSYSNILLYPSLVQGEGAPAQLIKALEYFESTKCVDVIIIGRGGGSIEDLWAFNNEQLARCIFNMTIPVISAVGHETDFTICDFVADMRAPTPSAAAEIAVPDTNDMLVRFDNVDKRLKTILKRKTDMCAERYKSLCNRPLFLDPAYLFENKYLIVDHNSEKLYSGFESLILKASTKFERATSKLDALSPLKIISRGYLFAKTETDKIIKTTNDISVGDKVSLKLSDGSAKCTITDVYGD